MNRAAAAAVLSLALTGCGSTVALPSSGPQTTADGLAPPGATAAPAADSAGVPDAPTADGTQLGMTTRNAVASSSPSAAAPGVVGTGVPAGSSGALRPVEIGLLTQSSSGEAGKSLGLKAADNGDEAAFARVVVDDVNARSGLGGRRVVPVVYNIDTSEYNDNQNVVLQRACTRFTQDHHVVAAVVSWHARGVHSFEACMEKTQALTVDPNGQITGDATTLRAYPHYVTPNGLGIDRVARLLPAGVGGAGFFGHEPIGVLASDTPDQHRAVDGQLRPALRAVGANLKTVYYLAPAESLSDAGRLSSELASAVLKFRSDGITRVVDLNGSVLLFATQAESQGYRPRYALTSGSAPAALTANGVPRAQLEGARAIGWMPVYDEEQVRPQDAPPGQRRCLDLMKRKGQQLSGATVIYTALTYCEELAFLKALADRVPPSTALTGSSLRSALPQVGGFSSALAFGTMVSLSRRDGASGYRTVGFQDDCGCFRYTTSVMSTSDEGRGGPR